MNADQEKSLVYKAQAGDSQALGELWDALTPKLFGYLVNVTHNKTVAEDLLQTTWLRAIQALPKFKQRSISISSWFFAIAHNECRQYWRKSNREVALDFYSHDQPDQSSDHYTQSEYRILVEQILTSLSEDDREIIRLRYIADLSLNDIAKILNINLIAVRVRLHRALARARKLL